MNQSKVPNENIEYIPREIPNVFFVLIVFIACGKNEEVVDIAASSPIIVVMLICDYFFKLFYLQPIGRFKNSLFKVNVFQKMMMLLKLFLLKILNSNCEHN